MQGWELETDWIVENEYGDQFYVDRRTNKTQWETPDPIQLGCLPLSEENTKICQRQETKESCISEIPSMNLCKWVGDYEEILPSGIRFSKRKPYGQHLFDNLAHDHFGYQTYYQLVNLHLLKKPYR